MASLDGKVGLVMGVVSEHSIAWAMSEALYREGADLAFTYFPSPAAERRVRNLSEPHNAKVAMPCNVQQDEDVAAVFENIKQTYGRLDFLVHSIAFAPPADLRNPYLEMLINFLRGRPRVSRIGL